MDAPWEAWKRARRAAFRDRYPVYAVLVIGFLVLLGRAADRVDDWEALVLGIGAIPFLTELTSYYFVILFGFGLLWPRYPIAGVGLAITALLSGVAPALVSADDDRYTLISFLIVLYVVVVTYTVARTAAHTGDSRERSRSGNRDGAGRRCGPDGALACDGLERRM